MLIDDFLDLLVLEMGERNYTPVCTQNITFYIFVNNFG